MKEWNAQLYHSRQYNFLSTNRRRVFRASLVTLRQALSFYASEGWSLISVSIERNAEGTKVGYCAELRGT